MRRRDLLTVAGAVVAAHCGPAIAQAPLRPFRLGFLRSTDRRDATERFTVRLAELGHIEGRDFVIENSTHGGRIDRLPELAADLIKRRPDVIVAAGAEAVLKALLAATELIPIVFLAFDFDPVALGYVAGLPRPGGNLTGVFARQIELTVKRVELLKETIPALTDLAVFADAFTTDTSEQMRAAEGVAAELRLRLVPHVLPDAPQYNFDTAIEAVRKRGAQGVLALMSPGFFLVRERFVHSLLAQRMPASFGSREFADLGGLMGYGPNIIEMFGRAADYVDKILKGARPRDLPVEQPTRFELVVNLRTAKSFGGSIPPTILARADEVIE